MGLSQRGKKIEREWCRWLRGWNDHEGRQVEADRTRQWRGTSDPDVRSTLLWGTVPVAWEVTGRGDCRIGSEVLMAKWRQATEAAKSNEIAVVAWKEPRRGWRVTWCDDINHDLRPCLVTADAADWMTALGYRKST